MVLTERQKAAIRREENEFPRLFADYSERDYGTLFYKQSNAQSYDSNHAVLYPERIRDLSAVLRDITAFYKARGLTPLIYHPFRRDYFEENRAVFEENGYELTIEPPNHMAVLCEESRIIPAVGLEIRRLSRWDERITNDILIPNGEGYEAPVGRATMEHEGSYLFAGYVDGRAAVYIIMHTTAELTRFDYINTAKELRGRGYARQLSHAMVSFHREAGLPLGATWFANDTSARLNYDAGFRYTDFYLESGYATYKK